MSHWDQAPFMASMDRQVASTRYFKRFRLEDRGHSTQCWISTYSQVKGGYTRVRSANHGPMTLTHRWVLIICGRPIPTGMEVDHLCRQPACARPSHLEVVHPLINNARSDSPTAINKRKTHCDHGHKFDESNTHITVADTRQCKACWRLIRQRRNERAVKQ